jgi:pimeloyl-ACP methyl ester carboxylesterase
MAINGRSRTTAVAVTLLAGGTVATAAALSRRANPSRTKLPAVETTPSHRAGSGTPLLLLHGIGATWRVWSPVLPHLESHHDVIVPTLPGHGGGPALDPDTVVSLRALTDDIEKQLDRLGLDRVHIAGNSLGGRIGIELARRGRARSLVLFSPPGAWRSQRGIALRARGVQLSLGTLSRYASRADRIAGNGILRRSLLAAQVAHPDRVAPEELAASIRDSAHPSIVMPLLREFPLAQVLPLAETRDYPVRLVWPSQDRVLPFKGFGAPMLERLPGAELIHLHGVGHVPMSDDPVAVSRLILEVTGAVDNSASPQASREQDA